MLECSKAVMRRPHDSRFATRWFLAHGIDVDAGRDILGNYARIFLRNAHERITIRSHYQRL